MGKKLIIGLASSTGERNGDRVRTYEKGKGERKKERKKERKEGRKEGRG